MANINIKFVDASTGRSMDEAIKTYLRKVERTLNNNASIRMRSVLLESTRQHVQQRYPGSKHYSPKKIKNSWASKREGKPTGAINADILGICRAYHNHLIKPKRAKWLTIPVHEKSKGVSVKQFNFRHRNNKLFKPKGKNVLAIKDESSPNGISVMYALSKKAYQKRDKTLLPTDHKYSQLLIAELKEILNAV